MARPDRSLGPFAFSGAPTAGTDEVQTLTFGGTWEDGDTFRLRFEGARTAEIAWSATNATLVSNIDAALGALHTVNGAANVTTAVGTMTDGIGTITVTFVAALGKKAVATIAVASTTTDAGTLAVAETTPGVDATLRGASPGAIAVRTDASHKAYLNTGSAVAPTWTVIGSQS